MFSGLSTSVDEDVLLLPTSSSSSSSAAAASSSSSSSAVAARVSFGITFGAVKAVRVLALFLAYDLLRGLHVIPGLFLIQLAAFAPFDMDRKVSPRKSCPRRDNSYEYEAPVKRHRREVVKKQELNNTEEHELASGLYENPISLEGIRSPIYRSKLSLTVASVTFGDLDPISSEAAGDLATKVFANKKVPFEGKKTLILHRTTDDFNKGDVHLDKHLTASGVLPQNLLPDCQSLSSLSRPGGVGLQVPKLIKARGALVDCQVCHRTVKSGSYTQHLKTHSREKPFSCDICQAQFTRNGDVARHKHLIHAKSVVSVGYEHTEQIRDKEAFREHKKSTKTLFQCFACGHRFAKEEYYANHMNFVHPSTNALPPNEQLSHSISDNDNTPEVNYLVQTKDPNQAILLTEKQFQELQTTASVVKVCEVQESRDNFSETFEIDSVQTLINAVEELIQTHDNQAASTSDQPEINKGKK